MAESASELVQNTCKSNQSFKDNIFLVKEFVKTNNDKAIKEIISEIKKIIKEKKHNPLQKLLALDLFHDCLMLKNLPFIIFSQEKILKRLSTLAVKRSADLFHDSNRSLENKSNSELFLSHLLNDIQVWGQTFNKANFGESTAFEKTFIQLKSKVRFPPIETQGTVVRPEKVALKTSQNVLPDQQLFESLETILTLVENLEDLKNDSALELMKCIKDSKEHFLNVLNRVCNENDHVVIDRVFGINDRINRIESIEKEEKRPKSILVGPEVKTKQRFLTGNVRIASEIIEKNKHQSTGSFGSDLNEGKASSGRNSLTGVLNNASKITKNQEIKEKDSEEKKTEKSLKTTEDLKIEKPATPKANQPKIAQPEPQPNIGKFENIQLKSRTSEEIKPKPSENVKSPEPKPFNIFDDILDLEIKPLPASNPPATQSLFPDFFSPFKTQGSNPFDMFPVFSSPSEPLTSQVSESPASLSQGLKKPEPISSYNESSALRQSLQEKDEIISNLRVQVQALQSKNQALEDALNKTKSILFSKEKECEDLHILRPLPSIDSLFEVPTKVQLAKNDPEEFCDNEKTFPRILCEKSGVLHEDQQIRLEFQIKRQSSKVKINCHLVNKGPAEVRSLKLDLKSDFFQIQAEPNFCESLDSGKIFTFLITGKLVKPTSIFPRLLLRYSKENLEFHLNLKFPLNICQFSSPLDFQILSISQEWQELVFAGENHKIPCDRKKFDPEIVKFGKNVEVLNSQQLETLSSREFFVFFYLGELVFALIRVKRKEPEAEVEIRSNDVELRKHFLNLLEIKLGSD